MVLVLTVAVSDEEDDNDNKSDKSDDDNEQGAKAKGQSRDGSTPQPEGADPQPKSDGQQEEEHQPQKKRHSRQDWEARIAELPLRSEPVGLDRHHRKYWLLSGLSPQSYVMHEATQMTCVAPSGSWACAAHVVASDTRGAHRGLLHECSLYDACVGLMLQSGKTQLWSMTSQCLIWLVPCKPINPTLRIINWCREQ